MLKSLALASWLAVTLLAQDSIHPNVDGFKYPALAKSARVQGTVQFLVTPGGIRVSSGHPMLVLAARNNLEKWAAPGSLSAPLSVTYNFRLTDAITTQVVETDEPIGNSFDRFFLRLFRRPVSRRVKRDDCVDAKESPAEFKIGMLD